MRYLLLALVASMMISVGTATANDVGNLITDGGAGALVAPFDLTENRTSFAIVSRVDSGNSETLATHWSYWSTDCRHIINVWVCLTPEDTKVMDPTQIATEFQSAVSGENVQVGSISDLTGQAGFLTITAFPADSDSFGCLPSDLEPVSGSLKGGWVIADISSQAAYGNDMWGFDGNLLPDVRRLDKVSVQSFSPSSLEAGFGIVIALQEQRGRGDLLEHEIGPIDAEEETCCNLSYIDNLEVEISLPDVCFQHAGFADVNGVLIPSTTSINAPGQAHLQNCTVDGDPIEQGQFLLFAVAEAVGPFGIAIAASYTGGQEVGPLPVPSPSSSPTPLPLPEAQPPPVFE